MVATKKPSKTPTKPAKKRLNLALQGGGAHGAFTWGVLDRLLEEEDISITGISGTSAGAMNAAVLVEGYNEGGRSCAKEQLATFWQSISEAAAPLQPWNKALIPDGGALFTWLNAFNPITVMQQTFSPYETNPMNLNPLRDILENLIHPEHLHSDIKLFVTATNVETGQPRVFSGREITIDVLLASACLPLLYQAVEIDGVPYWDGGYVGNPAIWPLIYKTDCDDTLLVQINPLERKGTPKKSADILDRLNEISFNASLIAEMRAINFVKKLIESGRLKDDHYTDVRMHMVQPPENLKCMNASSKSNTDWDFLLSLKEAGRSQMTAWLKKHKSSIGRISSLDIATDFLFNPAISSRRSSQKRK